MNSFDMKYDEMMTKLLILFAQSFTFNFPFQRST